jgi:hypothetical protein
LSCERHRGRGKRADGNVRAWFDTVDENHVRGDRLCVLAR